MNRYIQALSLELSILDRLLKRHRCSHGRAIYFRRISMVVQAARKRDLLNQLGVRFQSLDHATVEYCQRCKRKRIEEQWDIQGAILTSEQQLIREDFGTIQSLLTDGVQELLSRIDHASPMLFLEVSRGFFLPFCTVALATLARIRALLLRIGRIGLSKLQSMLTVEEALRKFLSITKTRVETCMTQYLQEDQEPVINGTESGLVSIDERRAVLVQSLGFTYAKTGSSRKGQQAKELDVEVVDDVDEVELDPSVTEDHKIERMKTDTSPPSRMTSGDDDIGECVGFSPKIDVTFMNLQSQAPPNDADPMDRNMEILETLKGAKKRQSSCKIPSKKRKDEKKAKTKTKKKTTSSGDFFDALFG